MNYLKLCICILLCTASLVHADESTFDKAKNGAVELWDKTKETTSNVIESTSEAATVMGNKASQLSERASKNVKETGSTVWEKMKDIGSATADGARKGASKIRSLAGEEKNNCSEDSALCYQNKE
ncbi:hypothetical protein N5P32_04020 [Marinomonas pontica]|uniref:hypothetical protein n=1 Tax=Marinomonas pontica TaxID=264739 RepID=UPI0022436BA5|nr:hypothetical protein [Marinomonas pontica]MCW8355126.1 hypothetical protein [Marinomonas pontica]